MTTLQLRVVLAVVELGSISAAAKTLGVSQPNASSSLRQLEEEIGFPLFFRTSTGAILTKKGEAFLPHARSILAEQEKILELCTEEEVYRLRLGTANYTSVIGPFLTLCTAHREDAETDFHYQSVSVEEGISALVSRSLDLVIVPAMRHQMVALRSECKKNFLSMLPQGRIPSVITVRKGHPAALDGRCRNIVQGSDVLKEFPYVTYRNLEEDTGSMGYKDSDFIPCSYKMYVDEVDIRLRLVAATNAFSFGLRTPDHVLDRYGLVSFPVPGVVLDLFALTRFGETNRREITDYLLLLKKELDFLR